MLNFRSSPSLMFFKIGVLKNFATFTGKHLCWPLQAFFYRTPTVAASGFSRQQKSAKIFFSWIWYLLSNSFKNASKTSEAATGTPFFKKSVRRNFANFTGKRLCWSLFLIESQALRPAALLKRDSNTDILLWNLQNF